MQTALGELRIEGIKTTIPRQLEILRHSAFAAGTVDIKFIERTWPGNRPVGWYCRDCSRQQCRTRQCGGFLDSRCVAAAAARVCQAAAGSGGFP